jgi:hypothetical protein
MMASDVNWQELAACAVELPDLDLFPDDPEGDEEYKDAYEAALADTSFVRKPNDLEERRWAKTCASCPVFSECLAFADATDAKDVYVAGEWRE